MATSERFQRPIFEENIERSGDPSILTRSNDRSRGSGYRGNVRVALGEFHDVAFLHVEYVGKYRYRVSLEVDDGGSLLRRGVIRAT